jgi:tetratricopeptide (TPR) repeat protein
MTAKDPKLCAEVTERMAEVLDGTAEARLLEHVSDCDDCRDAKHDAERATKVVRDAAGDYRGPREGFERRVMEAVGREEEDEVGVEPGGTKEEEVKGAGVGGGGRTGAGRRERRGGKWGEMGLGKREIWVVRGVAALALAAGVGLFLRGKGDGAGGIGRDGGSWGGKVGRVVTAEGGHGLVACDESGSACRVVTAGAELPRGARLKTDARTRAELALSDGSKLSLDRSTELALQTEGPRRATLIRGALVADIAHAKTEARFGLPKGSLTVHGTKFALRAADGRAAVDVTRGSVTLAGNDPRGVQVTEGETGRLEDGTPSVTFSGNLGESLAWSDDTFGDGRSQELASKGLGELKAKKPGDDAERAGAVTLASHQVRVRIAGVMARTEVEEVFENHTDDVLEGIYRFPVPPEAQIERLALEVDGKLEEGAFVDRDRAAAIWRGAIVNSAPKARRPIEEIVWVPGPWRDPALLEWQRGGRFELRIFPIPKRGSRRVILAYTEVVKATGGTRRYHYPLPYDPSGSTRVGRFDVNVEVRGNDRDFGVRPTGYAMVPKAVEGASALTLSERGFVPSGDLSLEYALPNRNSELTTFTYLGSSPAPSGSSALTVMTDGSPYVALALRPKLPRGERFGNRQLALVVDSSRSMLGESYQRATDLAARIARELDPGDRLSVLACGVECRTLPGGPLEPGVSAAAEVRRFLAGITPEDGSDLVEAVSHGISALSGSGEGERRVIYLGDGAPTVGQVRPGSVERAVLRRTASRRASVTAVAVGTSSDRTTLEALARGGGGVMLPYAPGQSLSEAAYAVLGATYGDALTDVNLRLPEGLGSVAPARLGAIPAGGEVFVTARMNNLDLAGDVVLSGKIGGRAFEQRYPVKLSASDARGNVFVERLHAAARIQDLERDGTDLAKKEAVALSSRFSVASRYTSLLVLESEAMFKAFGLDNQRTAAVFTGEEEAESSEAEGIIDVGTGDEQARFSGRAAESSGLSSIANGTGGGGLARAKSRAPSGLPGDPLFDASAAPAAAPKPVATTAAPPSPEKKATRVRGDPLLLEEPPPSRRRMIPMRKVWQRFGEIYADRLTPRHASGSAVADAEQVLALNENRREALKKVLALSFATASLDRAAELSRRWSEKEPLDPEAITARADVLAARGERDAAIRVLGSVIDVRPDDVAAQKRLARLQRWRGRTALGCRHSIAIAELRAGDAGLLADAVRCARETGDGAMADELLANAGASTSAAAARLLGGPAPDDRALKGDLRIEGSWSGGADLDLALIDPDGRRVSWLGAPTRGLISARDVVSTSTETLALSGGKPGEYVVEVVRGDGTGRASGELTITVAGATRRVPFSIDGQRVNVAILKIDTRQVLVPL